MDQSTRIIPTLQTDRLIMRPFNQADAKRVKLLAGHSDVAATTANLPHPYSDGAAEGWISMQQPAFEKLSGLVLAIELKTSNELVGCVSLMGISQPDSKAEVGYWIGLDYWNKGYCSEAVSKIFDYAFDELALNKITSRHMKINQSSGRVMIKCGMKHEGTLRQEFRKNGIFHDLEVYGLLKSER